jgi:hypothetical protein
VILFFESEFTGIIIIEKQTGSGRNKSESIIFN